MKCIWKIPNRNNLDEGIDSCPTCQSVLITFDGKRMLCPSCAGREIDRLRKLVKRLTRRALDGAKRTAQKGSISGKRSVGTRRQ